MAQLREDAEARLAALWREHGAQVLGYATRHVGADDAEEITAETFVVAWRRLDDVPEQAAAGWLLVVARNLIGRRYRSTRRRRAVERALRASVQTQAAVASAESAALEKVELVRALWQLNAPEREALLLVAWDGLSLSDGAQVAGCSVSAFTMRVSRARHHLLATMQAAADPPRWRPGSGRGDPARVEAVRASDRHG